MLHCPGTEKAAVVTKMMLTLSADHRIFDGQVGGIYHLSPVISPVCSRVIYTPLYVTLWNRQVFHGAGIELQRHQEAAFVNERCCVTVFPRILWRRWPKKRY